MHKPRNLLNLLGNVCIWRITLAKLWLAKTIVRVINKVAFTKRRGVRNDKKSLRNWVRRISTWRTAPMNSCLRQHQVNLHRNGFSYRSHNLLFIMDYKPETLSQRTLLTNELVSNWLGLYLQKKALKNTTFVESFRFTLELSLLKF